MRSLTGSAGGLLLVLALLGCGAGPDAETTSEVVATPTPTATPSDAARERRAREPRARTPRPEPTPGPAASPDDGLGDLADLAEQQSSRQRRQAARSGPVLGADVSWPQCPVGMGIPERRTLGLPPPLPSARYVVIGLTNGPAFTDNPCLADQVASARGTGRATAAYAVTSYPDSATLAATGDEGPYDGDTTGGALGNSGYAQARFGVGEIKRAGLVTPVVWVDVEPVADFEWSTDLAANAAVVRGVVLGYQDAGYEVGVYSTPYLWETIVGDLELGLPEWRAAGQTSRAEALARCGPEWSIQGGEPVLGQWVEAGRDLNVTCPGVSADLSRWFSAP